MTDAERRARLDQSWDANAAAWAETIARGTESRRAGTDAAAVRAVQAALAESGPGRVLDVGCGEGWLMRALRAHGITAEGVDGSAELARQADARHLTYAQAVADPARLGGPFAAVVFSFALLDDEPSPVLAAAASRLRDGGHVIVQTLHPSRVAPPYTPGWREESFGGFGEVAFEPMPWYFHTFGAWVAALRRAGLDLVQADEPVHPESGLPLSLVLTAQRA